MKLGNIILLNDDTTDHNQNMIPVNINYEIAQNYCPAQIVLLISLSHKGITVTIMLK